MYQESKNATKRLTKAVAVLLLIMIALVGTIVSLTAHVIEQSKETETDSSGITTVKGSPGKVTATGTATLQREIYDAPRMTAAALVKVTSVTFVDPVDEEVFAYTITGFRKTPKTKSVTFFSSRRDTVFVSNNTITCRDADGKFLFNKTRAQEQKRVRRHAMRRRRLLANDYDYDDQPAVEPEGKTEAQKKKAAEIAAKIAASGISPEDLLKQIEKNKNKQKELELELQKEVGDVMKATIEPQITPAQTAFLASDGFDMEDMLAG